MCQLLFSQVKLLEQLVSFGVMVVKAALKEEMQVGLNAYPLYKRF
jgi:hypothetical protein